MRTLAFFALAVGAIGTAGYAIVALFSKAIQSPVFRELVTTVEWSGKLHIVAGAMALILGLIQLSSRIRNYSLELHKNVGRIYVVLVLLSTTGAMVSLPSSTSGLAAKSAFWFLAILWPIVTIAGYPFRGDFSRSRHARFMIVSFALTCSAVSLRIYLALMLSLGIGFDICYPIAAWGGLITNLLVAMFFLLNMNPGTTTRTAMR